MVDKKREQFEGICAVCFDSIVLDGKRHPKRHGFSTHNVKHGQHGGFHSGPCAGWRFLSFNESDEGTKWALVQTMNQRVANEDEQKKHKAKPLLQWAWEPMRWERSNGAKTVFFDVTPGMQPEYVKPEGATHSEMRPSYTELWNKRDAQLQRQHEAIACWIERYTKALSKWKPQKLAPYKKLETWHLSREYQRKGSAGDVFKWLGPSCRFVRSHQTYKLNLTSDTNKVNCKRCQAHIAKEKSK